MKKPISAWISLVLVLLFLASSALFLAFIDIFTTSLSLERYETEESKALLETFIGLMGDGDLEEAKSLIISEAQDIDTGLAQIYSLLENNPIKEYEVIGVHRNTHRGTSGETVNVQYTIQTYHERDFGIISAQIKTENNSSWITNFRIEPMDQTMEEINSFYKVPFGKKRLLLLAIYLILIGFVIFTLIHYFKNAEKVKWGNILLLSLSTVSIAINWNNLEVAFQLLSVSLSPTGLARPANVGIWQMKLYLPLFSLLYWFGMRHKMLKEKAKKQSPSEEVEYNKVENTKTF